VLKALLMWKKGWGFSTGGNRGVRFEIDAGCIVGFDMYVR
jgi:hypothetical protein